MSLTGKKRGKAGFTFKALVRVLDAAVFLAAARERTVRECVLRADETPFQAPNPMTTAAAATIVRVPDFIVFSPPALLESTCKTSIPNAKTVNAINDNVTAQRHGNLEGKLPTGAQQMKPRGSAFILTKSGVKVYESRRQLSPECCFAALSI